MTTPELTGEPRPEKDQGKIANRSGTAATPSGADAAAPVAGEAATPLTADEQMALYEKELKENDWGHQPC
jgi:hypothetical protein